MNQILALKKAMKSDPVTAGMIKPSTRNTIFMDWDKNGTIDFAFISSKGDGKIDTFAIDLTGDGECDMYFYDTDGNGVCDDIRFYSAGSDTPSYTYRGEDVEKLLEKEALDVLGLLKGKFDGASFINSLKEVREHIFFFAQQLQVKGALGRFKMKLRSYPQTAKMIMPSAKNEIYLDLNGDGAADFAFVSSKNDDNIDTFSVDASGTGEFDLYLCDVDGNGIADDVSYYSSGSDEPDLAFGGEEVEDELEEATMRFSEILKKNASVIELIAVLRMYKNAIIKLIE